MSAWKVTRTTKLVENPLYNQLVSAMQKAASGFVGMEVSPETRAKLESCLTRVVADEFAGKSEVGALYDQLPRRCKAGFWLLRKVRVPFLVHLLDAIWFRYQGSYRKSDIAWAKEILVGSLMIRASRPIELLNISFRLKKG